MISEHGFMKVRFRARRGVRIYARVAKMITIKSKREREVEVARASRRVCAKESNAGMYARTGHGRSLGLTLKQGGLC